MKSLKFWSLGLCLLILFILSSSCQKEDCKPSGDCDGDIGVFIEMEGCALVLELEDGKKIVDISFRFWDVKIDACTPYCVKFTEQPAATTSCLGAVVGQLLEVTEL